MSKTPDVPGSKLPPLDEQRRDAVIYVGGLELGLTTGNSIAGVVTRLQLLPTKKRVRDASNSQSITIRRPGLIDFHRPTVPPCRNPPGQERVSQRDPGPLRRD